MTDKIVDVDLSSEPKMIMGGSGTFSAEAVVLTTGAMGAAHGVAGEEEFLKQAVVATAGGASAALEVDKYVSVLKQSRADLS